MTPKIIAHRGHSHSYPENTMIAFRQAVELGADGIECDVHMTRDKKLVVHHYYVLGHTDTGEGYIFEKDLAYLKTLDYGTWFNAEFMGEKMPLLAELFEEFGRKILYEIELKDFGKAYVQAVLDLVKTNKLLETVQFISFQYPLLSYLKKCEPSATVGLIAQPTPNWMSNHIARECIRSSLIENIIDVNHCPIDVYDQKLVDDLHAMGVQVHAGICDTEEHLQKALDLGVDELTTNNLELALKVLRK
ncbi:MAG: glycerophosphodiester phosphodiesterase [bacterium]|nr:glycerophosphodiester phosphodiesterase [bacterium]